MSIPGSLGGLPFFFSIKIRTLSSRRKNWSSSAINKKKEVDLIQTYENKFRTII